jgi:hypothetical protein
MASGYYLHDTEPGPGIQHIKWADRNRTVTGGAGPKRPGFARRFRFWEKPAAISHQPSAVSLNGKNAYSFEIPIKTNSYRASWPLTAKSCGPPEPQAAPIPE